MHLSIQFSFSLVLGFDVLRQDGFVVILLSGAFSVSYIEFCDVIGLAPCAQSRASKGTESCLNILSYVSSKREAGQILRQVAF